MRGERALRSEDGRMLLAAVISAWVQYAADGKPQARALATKTCPTITYSGRSVPMTLRVPAVPAANFNEVVCVAPLPPDATAIAVEGKPLPTPPKRVQTAVVFGDTGCRMKGGEQQDCGDLESWPFPTIAKLIAAAHPDVVIHIGDYYYRESNCVPGVSGCINYWGDTSAAWIADWFHPAAPLFASVPLVLTRGNHEDCHRGGAGWFRYLEPGVATACPNPITADDGTPPYAIRFDDLRLVMLDSAADSSDATLDPARVAYYTRSFDTMPGLLGGPAGTSWLVTHRPPYAAVDAATALKAKPADVAGFDAVLAGHVHDFATVNLAGFPPLLVNGEGGDELDDPGDTEKFVGANHFTFADPKPFATKQFGYALYTRVQNGWAISLRDTDGLERESCFVGRTSSSPKTVACR